MRERLDLRYFVDGQHDRVGRRVHVEADDVAQLGGELGVVGALEGADTCRLCFLQMRCTELSPMATALAIARPVQWVAFARRLRAVQRQQPLHGLTRQRRLAGNARLLAQQPVHAQLREAVLPAPDRRTANTGTPRHLLHRQAISGMKDDLCLQHVPVRAATVAGNRGKARALVGRHENKNILSHRQRFARPTRLVNPFNGSVH